MSQMVDMNFTNDRRKEMKAAIDEISDVRKVAAYIKRSFSLWEAANCFMVKRVEINRELEEVAQFLTAEIVFDD